MHEVGPRFPDCAANGTRGGRNSPRAPLDERHRQRLGAELGCERAGRGRDEHLMAGSMRATVRRDEHLLGAPDAELLDHVEDSHSSS